MPKPKGKFWPQVRQMIWEKAEALFMIEQVNAFDLPVTPERSELREGGYFYRAKIIVLRSLYYQKKRKNLDDLEKLSIAEMEQALREFHEQ